MNVRLSDDQDDPLEPGDSPDLAALAVAVLRAEGVPETTELDITLVDPATMSQLNEAHMGRTGPTDVLAFPLEHLEPGNAAASHGAEAADGAGPPFAIGDVVICPEVVRANAAAAQVPFGDELALMVVHGVLHLLGYDHEEDAEAEVMEGRERELLAAAGRVRP